jgi:integrase
MQALPEIRLVLYRRKWNAEWYEDGSRFRRSSGTNDRSLADRWLRKFETEFAYERRPKSATVAYVWEDYRQWLSSKGRHAATTMSFEWKAIGPHFGKLPATSITERDCLDYTEKRRAQGRKDGTIWTELGHLRSALMFAAKRKIIDSAPAIFRPDRPAPRDVRLTRAQVKQFLDACELPHVRLFVVLAMTTGARSGALLGLTWDRIDFHLGLIHLHDPDLAKTNKGRALVPMNATARAALTAAKEGSTCEFVIEWAGRRVGSIKKALRGAGKRAGLPFVTAHVFRHSAATHLAEAGRPMSEIAQFLGHSDSRITERVYARYSPAYLRQAADALEIDLLRPAK